MVAKSEISCVSENNMATGGGENSKALRKLNLKVVEYAKRNFTGMKATVLAEGKLKLNVFWNKLMLR